MNTVSVRQAAIQSIAKFNLVAGKVDYRSRPIREVFGEHVFNEEERR